MKPDTSVKYFHSAMPGAPVLNGTAGATLAVLDACLVTGWGLRSVDSLVVSGNVATASFSSGNVMPVGTVVMVAGVTSSALNGEWRVSGATATAIQFVTEGIADQTATGSISLKIAPAGWEKAFTGANIATFRPTDPAASGMMLRVMDTTTTTCRVTGYETMVSADVGASPFPTAAQISGGLWWQKSNPTDTFPRPWFIVSDGRLFYYGKAYFSAYPTVFDVSVFGNVLTVKSVDPYAVVLYGRSDGDVSTPAAANQLSHSEYSVPNFYAARSYSGLGGAVELSRMAQTFGVSGQSSYPSGIDFGIPYPNPADGGLYLSPHLVFEGGVKTPSALRGALPGYYCVPQNMPPGTFNGGDLVIGGHSLPGRTLLAVASWYTTPPKNQVSFIDITGPWR